MADTIEDDVDDYVDEEEEKISGIMDIVVSRVAGEARKVYDIFHDVLTDTGYYTKIKNIESKDAQEVEKTVARVIAYISNIGIVLSIIIPAVLGIKYMIGSAEEKAEYKKDMVPYFVGATLLFSICTFVKILQAIGNQINKI